MAQFLSNCFQSTDIQSGCLWTSRSHNSGDTLSSIHSAAGTDCRRTCILFRDIASAAVFRIPGICTALNAISWIAMKKCKHLNKCIISLTLLDFDLRMSITARLSHKTWICWWAHDGPHTAHAITIGNSSFSAILFDSHSFNHGH